MGLWERPPPPKPSGFRLKLPWSDDNAKGDRKRKSPARFQSLQEKLILKLKDQAAMLCTAQAEMDKIRRELDMQIIEGKDERKKMNRKLAKLEDQIKEQLPLLQLLKKKLDVIKGALAERSRQLKIVIKERDEMAARLAAE